MTREEGALLAAAVRDALPMALRQQLKAIWVHPHLHNGHLTVRVFMVPVTAADPEPFVFAAHEI
jgi:hypothetical protein